MREGEGKMRERAALGTKGGKMIRGVHEERGEAVVGRLSRRVCGRGKFSTCSDVMLSTMLIVCIREKGLYEQLYRNEQTTG